jgi:hypothetical protein
MKKEKFHLYEESEQSMKKEQFNHYKESELINQ